MRSSVLNVAVLMLDLKYMISLLRNYSSSVNTQSVIIPANDSKSRCPNKIFDDLDNVLVTQSIDQRHIDVALRN